MSGSRSGIGQLVTSADITSALFLSEALRDVNPYDKKEQISLERDGAVCAAAFGRRMISRALHSLSTIRDDPNAQPNSVSPTVEVLFRDPEEENLIGG